MKITQKLRVYSQRVIWPGVVAASVLLAFWPAFIDEKMLNKIQRMEVGVASFFICVVVIAIARAARRHGLVKVIVSTDDAAMARFLESPGEHFASEANKWAHRTFGNLTISYADYKRWRDKNPKIFVAMIGPEQRLYGYFDVFPLTQRMGEAILSGEKAELDITYDDVLPPEEMHECCYVYIASVECCVANEVAEYRLVTCLASRLFRLYPPQRTRTYLAFDATDAGRRLLKRNEFTCIQDKNTGACKHSLYALEYAGALKVRERLDVSERKIHRHRLKLQEADPADAQARLTAVIDTYRGSGS